MRASRDGKANAARGVGGALSWVVTAATAAVVLSAIAMNAVVPAEAGPAPVRRSPSGIEARLIAVASSDVSE